MTREDAVALRHTRSRERADEWALVLAAVGLSPVVRSGGGGFALLLPESQAERAVETLAAYERENPSEDEREQAATAPVHSSLAGTFAAAALFLFFLFTGPPHAANPWFQLGSADAARILDGELWRTATALTLHANLAHVAANAVMGAILVNAVCGTFGGGLGLAAVLLAGMGGNAINALLRTSQHDAVGASTAVFAALGLLCGPALSRRRRRGARGRGMLAPLGAGVGVIAMLGVGDAPTDIWAHLFGFGVGVVLGLPLAFSQPKIPGPRVQLLFGALALTLLMGSWSLALLATGPI